MPRSWHQRRPAVDEWRRAHHHQVPPHGLNPIALAAGWRRRAGEDQAPSCSSACRGSAGARVRRWTTTNPDPWIVLIALGRGRHANFPHAGLSSAVLLRVAAELAAHRGEHLVGELAEPARL